MSNIIWFSNSTQFCSMLRGNMGLSDISEYYRYFWSLSDIVKYCLILSNIFCYCQILSDFVKYCLILLNIFRSESSSRTRPCEKNKKQKWNGKVWNSSNSHNLLSLDSSCFLILAAWYLQPDTGHLILDTWYLILDIWYLISDTWYLIFDIWYLNHYPTSFK